MLIFPGTAQACRKNGKAVKRIKLPYKNSPAQCSSHLSGGNIGAFMNTALAVGMDRTELADMIVKMKDPAFEEDMDTQAHKNGHWYDTITGEKYDLANSIYTGIAKYLNGLSSEERAQVLAGLYDTFVGANEDVQDVNGNYLSTLTLFIRVNCIFEKLYGSSL